MTVYQLHKQLGKLIEDGYGRAPVAVYKETFTHNLGEVQIHDVSGVRAWPINMCDDDGGFAQNKDGTERLRKTAVLFGANGCPKCAHAECVCD